MKMFGGLGKVCLFYQRGDCKFQDNCRNMHIPLQGGAHAYGTTAHVPATERLSGASGKGKICLYYQKGFCRFEDSCWNKHILGQGCTERLPNGKKCPLENPEDKKTPLEIQQEFVRHPLSCRDYDLSPTDADKPFIHVLVDDVMMQILEYLPLKERIICEVVCRRWQALLYAMFERTTDLVLAEAEYSPYPIKQNLNFIRIGANVNTDMVSKMLLLTGNKLKKLSLNVSDFSITKCCQRKIRNDYKEKLCFIIAQLCPNLEYLSLFKNGYLYFDHLDALSGCKNLKGFSSRHLKDDLFKELISVLPYLEKLNISGSWNLKGDFFNLLPEGLKELNISNCEAVSKQNFHKITMACKHLEVLEIEKLFADKEVLEDFAINCKSLRSLKLCYPWSPHEFSDQVKGFANLRSLKIVAKTFELSNIADDLKYLEELHIQLMMKTNMVDFSKFTQLKRLELFRSPFLKQELISLENCKRLQYIYIKRCKDSDQETIKRIVKGCTELKHIKWDMAQESIDGVEMFISDINKIMKNRSGPLEISVNEELFEDYFDFDDDDDELDGLFDKMKINFNSNAGDEDYDQDVDWSNDDDSDYDNIDSDDLDNMMNEPYAYGYNPFWSD